MRKNCCDMGFFLHVGKVFLILFCAALFSASTVKADGYNPISTRAFEQALNSDSSFSLYAPKDGAFKLNSSSFAGATSGIESSQVGTDTNQKLYALLIDGRYDFNSDNDGLSAPALRPYVSGGMGMAATGFGGGVSSSNTHEMSPLFRLGGGVAYRMGQQWNMSLDYKAGAALVTGDHVFTGRGQQAVDLQSLNLGMSYKF